MTEFLNAFKALMVFMDPWVLITAACIGIIMSIAAVIGYKRKAELHYKKRDPLDWIDDDSSL